MTPARAALLAALLLASSAARAQSADDVSPALRGAVAAYRAGDLSTAEASLRPLAGAYAEGKGVPKSFYDSYKWVAIAEHWNVPNASQLLETVAKELKPEEIEKAKKEAAAYTFKLK